AMNRAEVLVRRLDRLQRRHVVLAFPFAVAQKFGNDQAGAKAALIAYYGLFALFPLLLLLATILGFVLTGHPGLQRRVLASALANIPIIGNQLRGSTHGLRGSGLALAIGIAGTIYGAQGVGEAAQNAMNSIWNIPYKNWPSFLQRHGRAFLILAVLGLGTIVSTALTGFAAQIVHGVPARVGSVAISIAVNLGVFYTAFTVLTGESLGWRDVGPGVVLATLFWEVLQALGGFYVRHALVHANEVYGFFGIVIGLLSWLYVGAELTLLAAEINVVLRYRLWPRSMTQPPFTEQDKATFLRLARMTERRPEMSVSASFAPEADRQPLVEHTTAQRRPDRRHGT
ncbi:MAG: YihY/virulence factor BrkB family protein, partial [Acidimicrobiales bacterium]